MKNDANDVRKAWQEEEKEGMTMSIEEIRRRAAELERTIRARNFREYAGAAFVVLFFGVHAFLADRAIPRLGHALVVAGALYVVYQLHRRGSVKTVPADLAFGPIRSFHRVELERQRDLLQGVWIWYLLPFVPGLALLLVEAATFRAVLFGVFCAVLFIIIGAVNARVAREIDREIRELSEAEEKA